MHLTLNEVIAIAVIVTLLAGLVLANDGDVG